MKLQKHECLQFLVLQSTPGAAKARECHFYFTSMNENGLVKQGLNFRFSLKTFEITKARIFAVFGASKYPWCCQNQKMLFLLHVYEGKWPPKTRLEFSILVKNL